MTMPSAPQGRVRAVSLVVEALQSGGYRVSSPHARGWAAAAATPTELARAVRAAFVEVSCASYSRAKGVPYDLDALTTRVPGDPLATSPQARQRRTGPRRVVYDPREWAEQPDGRWRSPGGRMYRPDSAIVAGVRAKLEERPTSF